MRPLDSHGSSQEWLELDPEPRPPFHELRRQLHWMVQCIGAFGEALVEPQPDASHSAMSWDEEQRGLLGMPAGEGVRVGLALASPALYLKDPHGSIRARLEVPGRTLESCLQWTAERASELLGEPLARPLVLPEYALPEHAIAGGAVFGEFDEALLEQVARWFGDTVLALEEIRGELPGTGEIRCWPHHFDMAALWVMDPDQANAEKARSIGCGMLLGDDSVLEPYFYSNPWPRPLTEELPALEAGGSWHVKGWVGALLRAGELASSPAAQASQVATFFRSAIAANRQILGSRERN